MLFLCQDAKNQQKLSAPFKFLVILQLTVTFHGVGKRIPTVCLKC